MKEIVEKLENQRKDHEDGIKFMNLRKLREIVSIATCRAAHFSSNSVRWCPLSPAFYLKTNSFWFDWNRRGSAMCLAWRQKTSYSIKSNTRSHGREVEMPVTTSCSHPSWDPRCLTLGQPQEFNSQREHIPSSLRVSFSRDRNEHMLSYGLTHICVWCCRCTKAFQLYIEEYGGVRST